MMGAFFSKRILGFPVGAHLWVVAIVLLGLASALGVSDVAVFWLICVISAIATFTYGLQQSLR